MIDNTTVDNNLKDCAAIRIPPLLFFFICLGFGFLLEYLLPVDLIGIPLILRRIGGGTLLLFFGYFAVSAFIVLIKNKTPFIPAKPTIKIVQEGSFRFSRNPMYFSLLLLLSGIAILVFSIWLFIAIPVLYFLFLFFAVKPEESYLSGKFGKEYLDYKAKVRRWI